MTEVVENVPSDDGYAEETSTEVGYADASLRKDGRRVVGARRGDGRTQIHIETGSGDCSIKPGGAKPPAEAEE